ncbi:MAG: hypothetical protein U1F57_11170 [bacterium]
MVENVLNRFSRTSLAESASWTPFQAQVDGCVSAFAEGVSDWKNLSAMTAGSLFYRLGRVGTLALASRAGSAASLFRAVSYGIGLGAEVTVYQGVSEVLNSSRSKEEQGTWGSRWCTSFVQFGLLKLGGAVAIGQNPLFQHALQDAAMVAGHHLTSRFGLTPAPEGNLAEQFLHAEITNLQMGAGVRLLHQVFPALHGFEQSLDFSLRSGEGRFSNPFRALFPLRPLFAEARAGSKAGLPRFFSSNLAEFPSLQMQAVKMSDDSLRTVTSERPPETEIPSWQENIFKRFPEWAHLFSLLRGHPMPGDAAAQDAFGFFLRSRLITEPEAARKAYETGSGEEFLRETREAFSKVSEYFSRLERALRSLHAYRERMKETVSTSQDSENAYQLLTARLAYYLVERNRAPSDDWEQSLTKSFIRFLEDQGSGLPLDPQEARAWIEHGTFEWLTAFDFIARHLANGEPLSENLTERLRTDFPDVDHYREGAQNAISWEEIEALRFKHFKPGREWRNPRMMIVGIGREWELVERYAREGYDLHLVDSSEAVARFFAERQGELQTLSDEYGVKIQFLPGSILDQNPTLHPSFDYVEYHNVYDLYEEDTPVIHSFLAPGGLFLQYHPHRIYRDRLIHEQNYETLLHAENIPAPLGTFSQKMAYPLGNHLLVLRKPPRR